MEKPSLTLLNMVFCLGLMLAATSNAQTDSMTAPTVLKNSAPIITIGNNNRDTLELDSRHPFKADSIVYTVTSNDPESDLPITHTLTSIFPIGNPYFSVDRYNGSVRTKIDLRAADVREVELLITVADSKANHANFTLVLYIVLYTRPDITNLPDVKFISENKAKDYPIITLTAAPDTVKPTWTWTLKEPGEEYKFKLDTDTGRFTLAEALDYEKTQKYTVSFVISDGYSESIGDELTINVINENEPPYFDEVVYYCSLDESDVRAGSVAYVTVIMSCIKKKKTPMIGFSQTAVGLSQTWDTRRHFRVFEEKAGTSTCNIGAHVQDPERDAITFVGFQESVSRHFRYDMTSSVITLSEYDVDVQLDKLTYHLVARDSQGNQNKAAVPVHITVRDVNDNTCTIPPTTTVQLSENDKPTRRVFKFIQSDQDKTAPNNEVLFDVTQSVPDEANIHFAVATDGSVNYIEQIPETNNGKTYRLVVRCRDRGIPQRSAEGTIFFVYQLSTSTTTTTTTTPPTTAAVATSTDPFDNPAFVAIFAVFMIALVIALLVGLYFLLRYCGSLHYCFGIGPTPKKTRVMDISEYSNQSIVNYPPIRTNMAYNDDYWKNGDNYETGTGNAIPSSSRVMNGGFKRLALPAPAVSRGFNF
ncbi:unnamed protein product [Lymnaea stagnalis]|uniref:Cadherin domain-containing protein n=1 Tax=Lymnaea stagnalis TaxID=6523 RepID=A0AAV2HZY2_LYMST